MDRSADRVVIVVFDGLRPDMVAAGMPHLHAFAGEGVWFREASSVFPSVTRVCTTSIATGAWPGTHGIVGNAFHQPQVIRGRALDTSDFGHLSAARAAWGGRIVTTQSLGERLAAAGLRMGAVHCGSSGSAFLVNHAVAANRHWTFSVHGPDFTQTPAAVARAIALAGPLPGGDIPKFDHVAYAADVAIRMGLAEDGPEVLLVWFPEPDTSYHYRDLGSEPTRAVMAAADRAFARIVDAAQGLPGRTAILALSDHGQITTSSLVDLAGAMRADGLSVSAEPGETTRIAFTGGRSGELRMLTDDPGLPAAAADWLMGRSEVGMVFARGDLLDRIPGAFPLSLVRADHPRQAELLWVLADDGAEDRFGLAGQGAFTGGVPLGGGMHGGLNRREMNTVLMAAVPDGRRGAVDTAPAGLVDVAPTVLALLGLDAAGMEGRALPLHAPGPAPGAPARHEAGRAGFRQWLETGQAGGCGYLLSGGRA